MANKALRRARAGQELAGYVHGPAAAIETTTLALRRIDEVDPRSLILVEGISDQIAVETVARRRHRDLDAERVVVLPVGGAQGVGHFHRTGPCPLAWPGRPV